jgi:uncharacterized protein (DUF3084 family)
MEPPSSDAEALRDQETAQVRATHSLLVTANEFCDLECGQQPVRQSAASALTRVMDDFSRASSRQIEIPHEDVTRIAIARVSIALWPSLVIAITRVDF